GVLGRPEWCDQRHVVVDFVGVRDTAVRQIAGAAQGRKAAADIDRGQARVEQVLAGGHYTGKRAASAVDEDLGGVETGVLYSYESRVPGEAETEFIQQAWRKRMSLGQNARAADRR